jgi:ESCRT-II complex subunit VPS25
MDWPWEYSFPPFFTLQPHTPSRQKQIQSWKHLVISYCQVNTVSVLDLAEAGDLPLFHNQTIDRRLGIQEIREVCESLESSGNLEWTDKSRSRAYIFWKSPAQLGMEIYRWVQETGQTGTVMTLTELLEEGENGNSWKGVSHEIILKALLVLQKEKKAEVFEDDDGVKFF